MALYLVVAHQTAASPELVAELRRIMETDSEAEFVLLVPSTPVRHLLTWEEGDAAEVARTRARDARTALQEAGIPLIDTVVGAADPLEAVAHEHRERGRPYALTVISTLPAGISRWLHRDLPSQAASKLGIEVRHVVARPPRPATSRPEQAAEANIAAFAAAQPLDLPQAASWRGMSLQCPDGPLGEVHEVLYDYATLEPLWLGVASRPLPFRTLLVPARAVHLREGCLYTPLGREKIAGQPHVTVGEGFCSLTEQEAISAYFGYPFVEVRDVRVLHPGQELPGQERNQQQILEREHSAPRGGNGPA